MCAELQFAQRRYITNIAPSQLRFLDLWYERILGSGLLRAQIANLIARLILTLVDDIVGDMKMDMWSSGGGPRVLAGVEYRAVSQEGGEAGTGGLD